MFIQTEETPNPATLKFLPGTTVISEGSANFRSIETAEKSPLALALFEISGVTNVFLGEDFIAITKDETKDWQVIKPSLLGVIMEHFTAHRPVMLDNVVEATPNSTFEDEDEIVSQIKELLHTRVRPAVAQDGGDIVFENFEDGVVTLQMRGACAGCPSSSATLKMGVENLLRHYIPEVKEVRESLM